MATYIRIFIFFLSIDTMAFPVLIEGKLSIPNLEKIRIYKFDFPLQKSITLAEGLVKADGRYRISFDIKGPELASIFNNTVYISPYDTIKIDFQTTTLMQVSGKNKGNYTFFGYISNVDTPQLEQFGSNFNRYKQSLKSFYEDLSIKFLDFKKENQVSNEFIEFVNNEFRYKYLYNLTISYEKTLNDSLRRDYLLDVSFDDFNKDFFISNTYSMALRQYSYIVSNKKKDNTEDNLKHYIGVVNKMFKGKDKDFLNYFIFRIMAKTQLPSYKKLIDSTFVVFRKSIENELYLEQVNNWKNYYDLSNKPFPDEVLTSVAYAYDKQKMTFGDIIDRYKGKILYIDFWAKWCGGCISQFPYSKQIEAKFEEKDIVFLYFSVDDTIDDWLKGVKKHELNPDRQYFIGKMSKSKIIEYLKLSAIPRYIILNRKGELAILDAPTPMEKAALNLAFSEIK